MAKQNCRIGVRIELPTKYLDGVDVFKLYRKTYNARVLYGRVDDKCVVGCRYCDLLLARAGDEFKGVTSFSILLTCQYTREAVDRLVRIMNVLGDGKLIRERVSVFVSGKSVLNLMPDLKKAGR